MEVAEIVALLQSTAALGGAAGEALAELAPAFVEREFGPGETIVREGESGGEFFVLVEGQLEIVLPHRADVGGRSGTIEAGDTFGEIASLTGGRRLATITATTSGRLLVLDGVAFQSVLHRHPAMAETLLRSLERYMRS